MSGRGGGGGAWKEERVWMEGGVLSKFSDASDTDVLQWNRKVVGVMEEREGAMMEEGLVAGWG